MKKILILFIALFAMSCGEVKEECDEFHLQGVKICVKEGNHNYFLRMIEKDSLFVNIDFHKEGRRNFDYIYYTKGSIKSLSWETGGKYSEQVTHIQK